MGGVLAVGLPQTRKNTMKQILLAVAISAFVPAAIAQTATKPTAGQQAQAYYQQGQAAEKAGDAVAAKAAYTRALQLNPKHAHARYSLGQLKVNGGAIAAKGRESKFGSVVVPEFRVSEATLQESLDALGTIVEKESKKDVAPNFIIQDPKGELNDIKITLTLKKLPAGGVLKYVLDQARAKARYDEHAIVILPK